jgi:hypothetical protein
MLGALYGQVRSIPWIIFNVLGTFLQNEPHFCKNSNFCNQFPREYHFSLFIQGITVFFLPLCFTSNCNARRRAFWFLNIMYVRRAKVRSAQSLWKCKIRELNQIATSDAAPSLGLQESLLSASHRARHAPWHFIHTHLNAHIFQQHLHFISTCLEHRFNNISTTFRTLSIHPISGKNQVVFM